MSVVSMGELLIDFVALENGVTVGEASGFQKKPGGAPANVAVAVARLGHGSAFIGQVGDDPFGHFLADVLEAENVNVEGLRFCTEARTMLAFVSLAADGERSFSFYRHPSADMLMTPDDIATDVIASSDIFHFGSITLINSPAREATLHAVQSAVDAGKLISYDPNLRLALWPSAEAAREGMRHGLAYAHIAKISDEDLAFMLRDGESIESFFELYDNLQVIYHTFGRDGAHAYLRGAGKVAEHPGYAVESVDTTGAGDSFVAAVLVKTLEHLQENRSMETLDFSALLDFANATGALATMQRGAIPSLPTYGQVERFLETQ